MPSRIILVTGGCRSGKSSYAQTLCERLCKEPIYLATSSLNQKYTDDDFQQRIQRHQQDRAERDGCTWTTIEESLELSKPTDQFLGKVVLVDCLTLWLTNFLLKEGAFELENDAAAASASTSNDNTKNDDDTTNKTNASERALTAAKEEFNKLMEPWNVTYVCVTNEVGSGTHASNGIGRQFVDVQGWLNQYVASKAERVIHVVCGIPTVIKPSSSIEASNGTRTTNVPRPTREQRDDAQLLDKVLSARGITMDKNGYWIIKVDPTKSVIRAEFYSCMLNDKGEVCDLKGVKIKCCGEGKKERPEPFKIFEGRTAKELQAKIFEQWEDINLVMTRLDHACYVGREIQRAERCLFEGIHYQQN